MSSTTRASRSLAGAWRLIFGGIVLLACALVVLAAGEAKPTPDAEAPAAAPLVWRSYDYMPLEWNGNRRPVAYEHMFMGDRPGRRR